MYVSEFSTLKYEKGFLEMIVTGPGGNVQDNEYITPLHTSRLKATLYIYLNSVLALIKVIYPGKVVLL